MFKQLYFLEPTARKTASVSTDDITKQQHQHKLTFLQKISSELPIVEISRMITKHSQ
jgi:hypothetical protein